MERRHHRATFQRLLSTGAVAATLGLAFLLLLAPGATAAPACTGFQVKQGKMPTKTAPGRRLRLSYSVRNVDATARDVALGLIVPPSAIVQKSGSTTHQSKRVTPTNATLIDAQLQPAFGVYFPTSTLLGKKSRKFSATFTVAKCATMPASLLFQARLIDVKNNAIVCTQDFAQQKVAVEVPRRYKSQTNSTKAGKVCPLSFQLTDIGSRCAEAGNPTTFLGPQPTVTQCYQYCYNYGGTPPPAYFEYAITDQGTSCACVGATCTRMPAAGSFVLQTLTGAPAPPIPVPEGEYPATIEEDVVTLSDNLLPYPSGVWNRAANGATPALTKQEIIPITDPAAIAAATGYPQWAIPQSLYDGPFETAYLQQVDPTNNNARAFSGVYYYPPGESAFNGLLFKDFVLNGFDGSYWFYILQTATKRAPSYKIMVYSPSSGSSSTFVWTPALNEASQGTIVQQTWIEHAFNEDTGSSLPWLTDATAGDGWWCSSRCLVGPEITLPAQAAVLRNLKTYVNTLLSMPTTSLGYQNIQDAVIVGFRLDIGSFERNATGFTGDFRISTPRPQPIYSWSWNFGV